MHQLECVDDGPSPFDTLAQASISAKLRQALSLLSVDQRDVVWLCYFEDKSLSDIADIMQCPENTVKTRLFHARRKLREMVLV
jgi:RNA polymerase sigma-70 factor (ECF subfamily)